MYREMCQPMTVFVSHSLSASGCQHGTLHALLLCLTCCRQSADIAREVEAMHG